MLLQYSLLCALQIHPRKCGNFANLILMSHCGHTKVVLLTSTDSILISGHGRKKGRFSQKFRYHYSRNWPKYKFWTQKVLKKDTVHSASRPEDGSWHCFISLNHLMALIPEVHYLAAFYNGFKQEQKKWSSVFLYRQLHRWKRPEQSHWIQRISRIFFHNLNGTKICPLVPDIILRDSPLKS